MKTNKTLADVRPGGRVRLGDQAERARFEAWAEERELDTAKCSADGMKGDYADLNTDWCWAAWRAALSAQPSPGGQEDAWEIAELVRIDLDRQSCPDAYMRIAMESVVKHLAARQPVGEPVAVVGADFDLFWIGSGPIAPLVERNGLRPGSKLYAAPPAQAVDLGQLPDGWRLSKKATCYQLSHGNDIVGNLVGPDAEGNAAIIARVLDSKSGVIRG